MAEDGKGNGQGGPQEPRRKKRRKPNSTWPDAETMKQIIRLKAGIVTHVALAIDMDRRAVQRRLQKDPEFKQWFLDARDRNLDMSEGVVFKAINDGNLTAAFFHLKCHGKHRGWVERQEITGRDGRDLMDGLVNSRMIADGVREALMDPSTRKLIVQVRENIDARTIALRKATEESRDAAEDAVTKH